MRIDEFEVCADGSVTGLGVIHRRGRNVRQFERVGVLDAVSSSSLDNRTAVFVLLLVRVEGQPDVKE